MPPFTVNDLPAFNADLMIGTLEIGVLVSTCLFGVTCVQTYLYFRRFTADPWGMMVLVWIVWLLDLGHTVSVCHLLYTLTITDYGLGLQSLFIPPVSIDIVVLLGGFIGTIEQAWFTRRLYLFSKNIYLAGICAILSLARFVGSMGLSVVVLQKIPLPEYTTRWRWLVTVIMATAAANDVLLAAFLAYCLNRTKSRTIRGFSKLLDKLIIIAVESGAITSICAVALLACFLTMPLSNSIYIALYMVLGKLYSNAFLASLNARPLIRSSNAISVRDSDFLSTIPNLNFTSDESRSHYRTTYSIPQLVVTSPSIHSGVSDSDGTHQIIVTTEGHVLEKVAEHGDEVDERLETPTGPIL